MKHKGLIRTTYDVVTPESAEQGDFADTGWIDEEGQKLSPAEAVKWLRHEGVGPFEAEEAGSTSSGWYTVEAGTNYQTGAETRHSFHLKGYTPNQRRAIHEALLLGHGVPYRTGRAKTSYGERMARHRKTTHARSR
jgi:hypothetical protein